MLPHFALVGFVLLCQAAGSYLPDTQPQRWLGDVCMPALQELGRSTPHNFLNRHHQNSWTSGSCRVEIRVANFATYTQGLLGLTKPEGKDEVGYDFQIVPDTVQSAILNDMVRHVLLHNDFPAIENKVVAGSIPFLYYRIQQVA